MNQYTQITIEEREKIYMLKKTGWPPKVIANFMGRHKSTIYREFDRNSDANLGYLPDRADKMAKERKHRHKRKISRIPLLKLYVLQKLISEGWSPEMISGRSKLLSFPFKVSTETIYQYIFSNEGKDLGLYKYLLMGKPRRGKLYGRKPRGRILNRTSIHDRPSEVDDRQVFGHFEGDLIINTQSMSRNIAVIHERKTRFTMIVKNDTKRSSVVMQGIFDRLAQLPPEARKTITFDNGLEFAKHDVLNKINTSTYFCDPYSSWQKGGVENVNKMLRRFVPKNVPLRNIPNADIKQIERRINNLPRKSLGFRTAAETFEDEMSQL